MTWLSFGLGFCCGIFGWFCMCFLLFRGLDKSRDQSHDDMEILQNYRIETNKLSQDRNEILEAIVDLMKEVKSESTQG